MNIAATLSIFSFILVAACSRLPQPTVQHGNIQSQDHSNLQHPYPSINLGTLACEPKGLMKIPEGLCVGTPNAFPTMEQHACVCKNEDYIPVPTKAGHTCVHLFSILETIRVVHQKIRDQGITDADSEIPLIDISTQAIRALEAQIESGEDENDAVESEEISENPEAKEQALVAEREKRVAVDLSILAKDLRKVDRLLRENPKSAKLDRTFKYIQWTMEQYLRIDGMPDCLQIRGLASRRKLFAHYPPMQP